MKLTIKTILDGRSIRGSFTIWDLIAILVVVAIFGGWFAFAHSGERGRITRCAENLKELGEATQSYAKDHDDGLPAALIIGSASSVAWDRDLCPYLAPGIANAKSVYDQNLLMNACQRYFVCPSDPFQRTAPRSYAMAGRDMSYGWPPTSNDKTGAGLLWDKNTVSILDNEALLERAATNSDVFPRIKQALLLAPANTLMLTELPTADNQLGRPGKARVFANYQQSIVNAGLSHFHFGKFNYLMADGHVRLLTEGQADGSDEKSHNIWTINPND